jgi:hypothetical protein
MHKVKNKEIKLMFVSPPVIQKVGRTVNMSVGQSEYERNSKIIIIILRYENTSRALRPRPDVNITSPQLTYLCDMNAVPFEIKNNFVLKDQY